MVTTAASSPKIDIYDITDCLRETADELRTIWRMMSAECSIPVLELIFVRFAASRLTEAEMESAGSSTDRLGISNANYGVSGVLYSQEQPRFVNALAASAVA